MKRLVWCTDIHLDFIEDNVVSFAEHLQQQRPTGVFLTGDISLAPDVSRHLALLYSIVKCPLYFVCGNHDFYMGSIKEVRDQLGRLMADTPGIKYLTLSQHISLSNKTAIVGHDGWYDAYYGDPGRSPYVMTDWLKIKEYADHGCVKMGTYGSRVNTPVVVGLSRKLALEAADHIYATGTAAARSHATVIVSTHVPPFLEIHSRDSKGGSPIAAPWYTSKLMGDALLKLAEENPSTRFEVFCGHTHSQCDVSIRDNLACHVGASEYGKPGIAGQILFA